MARLLSDVIESFHATFMDKVAIPDSLEDMWLQKALAQYKVEIAPLSYNEETGEFDEDVEQYIIDTLAVMMKVAYLERCYNKYNKIVSIVGKDLSINGQGNISKYTEDELSKTKSDLEDRLYNLKPTAYNWEVML